MRVNLTEHWEKVGAIIAEYDLGSFGLDTIIGALDHRYNKPRRKEEPAMIDKYRKKIVDKAVVEISMYRETDPERAEKISRELYKFSARCGIPMHEHIEKSNQT